MPNPPSRPFREYSNEEFYEHLKNRNGDDPWTLSELVEVERRGYKFLDPDPELRSQIEVTKERFLESMRGALKPVTDNIREIGKQLVKDSSAKSLEIISEKWAQNYSDMFKIKSPLFDFLAKRTVEAPWLMEDRRNKEIIREFGEELARNVEEGSRFDVTEVTGPTEPNQMDLPAVDPDTIEVVKETFERQMWDEIGVKVVALLNKISTDTKETSDRVRFGWQQWVILFASVIAAIASVAGLFGHK
jgi:hypothetical protein